MPSNGTWAEMIDLGMDVTVYCSPCNRSVEIDMTQFPPDEDAIGRRYMCVRCGGRGQPICSPRSNKDRMPSETSLRLSSFMAGRGSVTKLKG